MTEIAVSHEGQGPPLVLLHAFPLHAGMWRPQAALAGAYSLLMPDLPGFGRSAGVPVRPSLDELAERVVDGVKRLGFQKAVVAGGSMGGYLAFALLRRMPDFVSGLALINTRAGADSTQARERRYATIERVKLGGAAFLREEWPNGALSQVTMQERPTVVSAVREIVGEATPEGVIAALQAMADRPDATSQLSGIRVPTVVIHGLDDPIIPAAEAQQMAAAIRGAKFIGIERSGHLPNMEEPDPVTNALRLLFA